MSKNRNHNTRETDEQVLKNSSAPEVAEETAEQTVVEAPSVQPETVNTDEAHENENEGGTGEVANENAEGKSGNTVAGDVSTETHEEKPEEPKQETKENESAKTVEIVCDQLYLRSTPSKKESPLSILLKGQKLTVLEDGEKLPEGWIKVNASGSVGYVMSEYTK